MRFGECIIKLHIYTWNPFVLYFGDLSLQNKVFSIQNRGHLGSRYIYIYIKVPCAILAQKNTHDVEGSLVIPFLRENMRKNN